jgi:hypothetical protein
MEPKCLLPCSEQLATGTLLEPDESTPHLPTQFPFYIILPSNPRSSEWCLPFEFFKKEFLMYFSFSLHHRVQNSSGAHPASYPVGTRALSLGLKRPGREADHSPPSSAKVTVSRTALESTQPLIQWVPEALSLGVKRPGSEADHLPPSSAEVKNAWSYTFTSPIRLHGVVLS